MNKRITLLVLISSIFYPLYAQKALNVDSVFTISMEIQSLTPSRSYTVPANKIWKIETMGQTCLNMGNGRIELNSKRTDMWGKNSFPIWVGSGDILSFIHTGGGSCWAYLSIIQFSLN